MLTPVAGVGTGLPRNGFCAASWPARAGRRRLRRELLRDVQLDRQGREVLLGPVVEVPLDPAPGLVDVLEQVQERGLEVLVGGVDRGPALAERDDDEQPDRDDRRCEQREVHPLRQQGRVDEPGLGDPQADHADDHERLRDPDRLQGAPGQVRQPEDEREHDDERGGRGEGGDRRR